MRIGRTGVLLFYYRYIMISKPYLLELLHQAIEETEFFMVDLRVLPDNEIIIELDHPQGVSIEDCVGVSKFIESKLDREQEDFSLEVGSAGISSPFKVLGQYLKYKGEEIEVLLKQGKKLFGELGDANETSFILIVTNKVKQEGSKRKVALQEEMIIEYTDVKQVKNIIRFK